MSATQILHQTAAFLSETLTQPNLRRHLSSTFLKTLPNNLINPLNFALQTIENAISTTSPSLRSSSLLLAEKLLHSNPNTAFSSFLLSLVYYLSHQRVKAALSLLHAFQSDPSFSRLEMAPFLFQELFLPHFAPIFDWYNGQRSLILSTSCNTHCYDSDRDDQSFVSTTTTTNLSKMSGDQALALKGLEKDYEALLDENCRIFVDYFVELLQNKDGDAIIDPATVVLHKSRKNDDDDDDDRDDEENYNIKSQGFGSTNRRYINPMWDEEGDNKKSVEVEKNNKVKRFPSFFPVRVSPKVLTNQELETSPNKIVEKENIKKKSLSCFMEDINGGGSKLHAPPKDFVCPITTHVFNDPVTLETGQTYERGAIQEWIDRGNSTCPITRQGLHTTQLPRTNYVLKRLIASWQEENPVVGEEQSLMKPAVRAVSPKSVIIQATNDGAMTELRVAINEVCSSEILREAEMGVLRIERLWKESNREAEVMRSMLSKPPVINGFVEVLLNSLDTQVLTATVVLLTELGSRDEGVVQALTRVDSDVECIIELFKKGVVEAVVLVHLLKPSVLSLLEVDLVDHLLELLSGREDGGVVKMCMEPKTAALLLLTRIVQSYAEENLVEIVTSIVSSRAIERIIASLRGERVEERVGAVSILLRCILEDGKCRNIVVEKVELGPLLEIFLVVNDGERFEIVHFLSELVKLNRRSLNEKILHVLKDEGTFSTMHTLLLYLQNASLDQSPIVAGLLLQLDLLEEPRKMSIYREEAMDTLIACLRNTESPVTQICAAETILSLQGTFSYSGRSLSRALLLKRAGFDRSYKAFMRKDQRRHNISAQPQDNMEDEKGAEEWERKVAFVLVSHEFGLVFEALAEGLKSNYKELYSVCFMIAAWLVYMLSILPDTGIRGAARVCLLHHFVSVFKSEKNTDERALSMLGLNTFIRDPEGLQDLVGHMKEILRGLRELKKSSAMAFEMLKVFSEEHENSADLWNHKELGLEDCSINGEVLTLACFKGKIFSGHSDGTIKVWISGEKEQLQLIQEVDEHTKAVTSLAVLHSSDKLYSGSLDRTVRVWTVRDEGIYCEQVEEMKDQINNLVVANSIACYIPQGGGGIKVHSWNGPSKQVNQHKYVKCLALVQGRVYCGCQDNSIQEIDLATGTVGNIQTGSKKLLVKANPIYALQVDEGLLYTGGPSIDGANVKIWSTSNYGLVGSLASTLDVRTMAVSSELVYLGCRAGSIEVWCKKKHTRVETLQTSSNAKILCMAFDANQDILLVGTSDGRIQTWGLN